MRIAIDVDSTLHHYWDVLSEVSVRRFGIELPYDEQFTWGITRLRPEQLEICIEESHSDERILAGTPYPGAVQAVRRWHEQGHFVHITSHRALDRKDATEAWLRRIELPFDDLHCSYDKVSRCAELEIDLLIDDGPMNLSAALERGILAATIGHPWNRDVCEEEDIVCAQDWIELEALLEPVLGMQVRSLAHGG
jgi:5'(3')-deoxyribonucleotidase